VNFLALKTLDYPYTNS